MNWSSTEFIWLDWLVLAIGVIGVVWAVWRAIVKDKLWHPLNENASEGVLFLRFFV